MTGRIVGMIRVDAHHCEPWRGLGQPPAGSVVRCDTCGRRYYLKPMGAHPQGGWWSKWKRVPWWKRVDVPPLLTLPDPIVFDDGPDFDPMHPPIDLLSPPTLKREARP